MRRTSNTPGVKKKISIIVTTGFRSGQLVIKNIPALDKKGSSFLEEILKSIDTNL